MRSTTTRPDDGTFPIDELVRRVGDGLAANGQGAAPTERTLRYYRTLGLLDPPVAHRGRTALYGSRHVVQVLAIKRLQADDVPLGDIQQHLVGRTDQELATVAGVAEPHQLADDAAAAEPDRARPRHAAPRPRSMRSAAFWAAAPSPAGRAPSPDATSPTLAAVELAPGVRLSFPADRTPSAADRAAVTTAAHQLLDELRSRGLLRDDDPDATAASGPERRTR